MIASSNSAKADEEKTNVIGSIQNNRKIIDTPSNENVGNVKSQIMKKRRLRGKTPVIPTCTPLDPYFRLELVDGRLQRPPGVVEALLEEGKITIELDKLPVRMMSDCVYSCVFHIHELTWPTVIYGEALVSGVCHGGNSAEPRPRMVPICVTRIGRNLRVTGTENCPSLWLHFEIL